MESRVVAQYLERYFSDRYSQVFELLTRDAEKEIKHYLKKVIPKTEKGMKIDYEVVIKPLIEVRRRW